MAALVNGSVLAILTFILTTNVLSPQFIIWPYPLAPLVAGRWTHVPWLASLAASLFTYYLYPTQYGSFIQGDPQMVYVLLARNLLLMALAGLLVVRSGPAAMNQACSAAAAPINAWPHFKSFAAVLELAVMVCSTLWAQASWSASAQPGGMSRSQPAIWYAPGCPSRYVPRRQRKSPQSGAGRDHPARRPVTGPTCLLPIPHPPAGPRR